MRASDRFASVLSDLMFLLLLSVLSVFAAAPTESKGEFDGLVNPTRSLRLECERLETVQLNWNGKTFGDVHTSEAGISNEGIVWSWIPPEGETQGALTLYFAGTITAGQMKFDATAGPAKLSWTPNRQGQAETGLFGFAKFQLDSESIQRTRQAE